MQRRTKRNAKTDLRVGCRKKSKTDQESTAKTDSEKAVGKLIWIKTDKEKVYHLCFVSERRELLIIDNRTAIIKSCNVDSFASRVLRSRSIGAIVAPRFKTFFDFVDSMWYTKPYIVRATSNASVVWFVRDNVVGCIENGVITSQTVDKTSGFLDGRFDVAQFGNIDDLAISSDGRFAFVSDRGNCRIRCLDRQSKQVFTVAGNGWYRDTGGTETDGPAMLASLASPDALCIDPYSIIPNSIVYFGTTTRIARLRLTETAPDVLNYYLVKWCGDRIWYLLIRDLWLLIAEYMAENASVTTIVNANGLAWSIAVLPSRHLLVGSNRSIQAINPKDGTKELITHSETNGTIPVFGAIRSMAIDQVSKCVYMSECNNSSLLIINLPPKYFSIPN